MRPSAVLLLIAAAACSPDTPEPTDRAEFMAPIFAAAATDHFDTHMTGDAERPTPNDSRAQGQTLFRLSADGESMTYRLIVANIENVTMAHIHRGPATGTGGIVVWLYPGAPPAQLIPGRTQGVLAEGTITSADLVGSLAGQTLETLIEEIRAGNAYVNVHTLQFPPGEIRGQID